MGVVGARFEVPGRMEYQDMITTRDQQADTSDSIQAVFARFYGGQVTRGSQRYKETRMLSGLYLDQEIYTKRIQISAETFLIEADQRGLLEEREVYCHVVGLGLGVWRISSEQNQYFLRETLQMSLK